MTWFLKIKFIKMKICKKYVLCILFKTYHLIVRKQCQCSNPRVSRFRCVFGCIQTGCPRHSCRVYQPFTVHSDWTRQSQFNGVKHDALVLEHM